MTNTTLLKNPFRHRAGAALEDLIDRHGPMVHRACLDILGDSEDAMDAAQATFLVFVRRAGSIRDEASTGRWLYEVARRVAWRERRRLARRRALERPMTTQEVTSPDVPGPEDREVRPILHAEIGRLPRKLRDPIVLCYLEGLTVEGAAGRLRCPVGTLKSRLGRGREVLRSRLSRRGLGGAAILLLLLALAEEAGASPAADAALKARLAGSPGARIPARVARMVRREELSRRLVAIGLGLGLMLLAFPAGSHARPSLIVPLLVLPPEAPAPPTSPDAPGPPTVPSVPPSGSGRPHACPFHSR